MSTETVLADDVLWVEIQFPDRPTQVLPVPRKHRVTLGRSSDSDVVIGHGSVSRRHAQLLHEDRRWFLQDCGSKNGSFLDQVRLTSRVAVGPEHWMRFGDVIARLHEADSTLVTGAEQRQRLTMGRSLEIRQRWLDAPESDLARSTLVSILELAGYTRGFIILRRADDQWTVKASVMLDSDVLDRWEFNGSRTAIAQCVRLGKPVVHNNVAENPMIAQRNSVVDAGIQAILCLPMRMDDTLIGVIYADDQSRIPGVSQSDLGILESLASHAAMLVALEHIEAAIARIGDDEMPRSDWYLASPDTADQYVMSIQAQADAGSAV